MFDVFVDYFVYTRCAGLGLLSSSPETRPIPFGFFMIQVYRAKKESMVHVTLDVEIVLRDYLLPTVHNCVGISS